MIAARTLKSKEAIDELVDSGENMEDIEIAASNAEKALNSIGLSARTSNGDFKDLEVILGEVAAKWGTLSDATKQYVSEQMAGNNRRSYFIGLMENYERVEQLQTKAENSSGKLMEASEKKANSLEGQLNKLQNAWARLYEAMINGSVAKGGVSALTKTINLLAKGLENLHIILPAVTASALVFKAAINGWTVVDQIKWIGMLAKETLTLLISKLGLATAAANGLNLAMLGLKALGIGAIIGVGIYAITNLINKNREAQESFENLSGSVTTLKEELDSLESRETTLANYAQAKQDLQDMVAGTEEYKAKQEELNQLEAEISGYGEQYHSILNNQYLSVEDQIEAMERLIALEEKQAVQEKLDGFNQRTVDNNVSDYNNAIGRARYEQQQIDKLKQEIAEEYARLEQTKNQVAIERINESIAQKERQIQQYQEARDENTQAAMEYLEDIENYNALLEEAKAKGVDTDFLPANISETSKEQLAELITLLGEVNDKAEETSEAVEEPIKKLGESLDSVFGGDYQADSFIKALDDLNKAMEGTEYTSEEAQDALKSLYKVFPELEGHVDDLGGAIEYLSNQAMLELCEQADQVNSILAEIGSEEFTGFDTSSAQELLSMYPELANHIQDVAYVQEFLNGKVQEYQDQINGLAETGGDAWKNYYDNVLAQDAEFWNTKLANSEEWAMYEQGIQQAMQQFGAELLGIETQDFADYINAKGGFREVDYSNCQNAAQAEGTLQSSLLSQMLAWYAQYVSDKGGNRQTDMSNVIAFLNTQGAKEAQTVNELKQLWAAYYSAKAKAIQSEMADIGTKLSALSSTGIEEEGFLEDGALKHKITKLQGSLKTLQNANTTVQNYFDSVNASFGGVAAGLSQLGAAAKTIGGNIGGGGSGYKPKTASGGSGGRGGSGGSGGSGSKRPSSGSGSGGRGSSGGSGSGGRGGSGSSSTEKEVKDLDLRIDKYTELEEAIKRAEEALSRNQEAQDAVTTKAELKKLLEQEIELMNKKKTALEKLKQAQIKEQQSLKSYLQRAGLIFNGDELVGDKVTGGSVTDRLKDAQNWANKASGAEKEWRIKDTQYLKEQIDTYYDLMNSIGSTQGSLNDLNLEIRNAKKEHEELLKAVENLSDRYLQITMRLERLNSELSINQRKQELAVGQELVSLRNRELQILKEKKALNQQNANELKEEQKELQDYLYKAGLRFAKDGTMTNYDQLWAAATKKYNGLAGTAAEDYKEYLDEIAEKTDRYLEILNSELPQVEEDLLDILQTEKELAKQQEEYAEQLRDLAYNYDYLFQVTQKLTKAEQELSLLESKMEHASYEERLDLLERQEEIYKSQLKLLQEQKRIQESMNLDRRNDLMKIGFEFDEDGFIKNYDKVVGAMYDKIQSSEGGAVRDEMIEDYDDLIAKVEEYNNSLANIKDSEQAWWDMNNAIKDAQQEQLNLIQEVQDSIKDAITNKWEETTDNLKKELEKQKELLNKQWEEEDWEDELTDAQDELNKIQAQINNLSKDTSLAGQLKLEQLKEDYKKQLEAMNEMIKDHEREMTNQVFEDESQRLDDQMEEALKTEQLMQSVNQALSTGFVTIGEQAIKLNDLLVDQLKEAKELWGDIASLGQAITNKTPSTAQLNSTRKTSSTVNTNAPLINVSITGDLDSRITLDDINRITKQASEDVMVKLYELMK